MARRRKRASREQPGPAGFLVVDKLPGRTSHDVVDAARRWLGTRRVGHLGTLDPQATGVLPLAVREATKLIPFIQNSDKSYMGTVRFGVETDTLDGEGAVVRTYEGELPTEAEILEGLRSFRGEIEQIPPMYSAVKKEGVPLHKLAREGREVEREPKTVTIHRLELLRFKVPEAEIAVDCSAGTYVRTLAADLGSQLGCGAYLMSLRRVRSGPFDASQAHRMEDCDAAAEAGEIGGLLLPAAEALGIPSLTLQGEAISRIRHGGEIPAGTTFRESPGARVMGVDPEGGLVALLELRADRRLWPLRVLAPIES